jgi:hypothetical protein
MRTDSKSVGFAIHGYTEDRRNSALTEAPAYASAWAQQLSITGAANVRIMLADFRRLAGDKRLVKRDRELSCQRAAALSRLL